MHVLSTRSGLREALDGVTRPIGLVPTMGGLHAGHRALMQRARSENATTVVTIFVNPRQFDDAADLARYPRDDSADIAVCEAEGVDIVWKPDAEEVYPPGFETTVSVGALGSRLEGEARPGHFDGVTTVVARLFGLVAADRAYFGRKDAQQLLIIERMVEDLAMATRIVPCPTVREADGLAISSRNVHLTPEQRSAAVVLYGALEAARRRWEGGVRDGDELRAVMRETVAGEPMAVLGYVSCADTATLEELQRFEGAAVLSLAATFGDTRLIDSELLATED